MTSNNERLHRVLERISEQSHRSGRTGEQIQLLVVSKSHPPQILHRLACESQTKLCFGESYIQEFIEKKTAFESLASFNPRTPTPEWHFIGRLQSRKLTLLCQHTQSLHAVCRPKELIFLAQQTSQCPQFHIQVNISGEASKAGVPIPNLESLMEQINNLSLDSHLLGLMGMAAPLNDVGENEVRRQFKLLRQLRDQYCPGKKLNMGMSDDFEIAIDEGSNLVRIGSAVLGPRPHP